MSSPRSSNYERLENGMGPSRIGGTRRFGWKKFAIAAVVVIGLVWVFGPRKEDINVSEDIPCACYLLPALLLAHLRYSIPKASIRKL